MSEVTEVTELPPCAFCDDLAQYEATMIAGGVHAYLCTEHWMAYGTKKLGPGLGQKLKVRR